MEYKYRTIFGFSLYCWRTESMIAWCSVDNWKPLTNSKFCVSELRSTSDNRGQDNSID